MLQLLATGRALPPHQGRATVCRPVTTAVGVPTPPSWRGAAVVKLICYGSHKQSQTHDGDWEDDKQLWIQREQVLLSELAAVRQQVDKLLDQQAMLLGMISSLSGLQSTGQSWPAVTGSSSSYTSSPRVTAPQPATVSSSVIRQAPSSSPSRPATPPQEDILSNLPTGLAQMFSDGSNSLLNESAEQAASNVMAAIQAVDEVDVLQDLTAWPRRTPTFQVPTVTPGTSSTSNAAQTVTSAAANASNASTSSTASSKTQAADSSADTASMPVEVLKAPPGGKPPHLALGDDDIYWLNTLHTALVERGFYPSDDDIENWFYGEGTQTAVLAFQASAAVPETGMVDEATWAALGISHQASSFSQSSDSKPTQSATNDSDEDDPDGLVASPSVAEAVKSAGSSSWPVLMDGDGGKAVHVMQRALRLKGYYADDDDTRWWMMGSSTADAVRFFQASAGLLESGVCDARTWQALLGPEAQPSDIERMASEFASDDEFADDLDQSGTGRVWLIGEQRWERKL